jgi:glycerol-3-phosphate dehydrogenase (NAD(P)+)
VSALASPIAILGAGSWGTALAIHLSRLGACARLWWRDPALMKHIEGSRENHRYLPGIPLPSGVQPTANAREALAGAGIVLVAVPSQFVEEVLDPIRDDIAAGAILVSAAKGLEPKRARRISTLLTDLRPGHPVAVLSGPSFAREVALGQPAALVVAALEDHVAVLLQKVFTGSTFRIYTNRDVIGVEIAGAVKNVMAIATGLCDGLELGENARAALITRGLAEIVRLGMALGAQPTTFLGLAGLGDLVLTCTGSLSRNRALGFEIARGRSLEQVEESTRMVAEGVRTVASALALARDSGVSMPICREVGAVLFEGRSVQEALRAHADAELFLYFSSCSIFDPEAQGSRYVRHKLYMEDLVAQFDSHLVLRLPVVVGSAGNANSLVRYLVDRVVAGQPVDIWKNAGRYLIESVATDWAAPRLVQWYIVA